MQHHYQRRMSLPTPNLCALLLTGPTTIMCLDHCIQTPRQLRLPLVRVPPPTLDFPSIKVEENIYTMKIRFCCTIYNEIILLLYIFFFTLIDKYTMKSCFVVFFFFFCTASHNGNTILLYSYTTKISPLEFGNDSRANSKPHV